LPFATVGSCLEPLASGDPTRACPVDLRGWVV
jgi:hypothetical protein